MTTFLKAIVSFGLVVVVACSGANDDGAKAQQELAAAKGVPRPASAAVTTPNVPAEPVRTVHFVASRERVESTLFRTDTVTIRGWFNGSANVGDHQMSVPKGTGDLATSIRVHQLPLGEISHAALQMLEGQHDKLAGILGDRSPDPLRVVFNTEGYYETILFPDGRTRTRLAPGTHNCESPRMASQGDLSHADLLFRVGGLTPELPPEFEKGAWHDLVRAYVCDVVRAGGAPERARPSCNYVLAGELAHGLVAYWDGARVEALLDTHQRVRLANREPFAVDATGGHIYDPRQLPPASKRVFDAAASRIFPLARLDYTGDMGLSIPRLQEGLEALALVEYVVDQRAMGIIGFLDEVRRAVQQGGPGADILDTDAKAWRRRLAERAGAVLVNEPWPQYVIP